MNFITFSVVKVERGNIGKRARQAAPLVGSRTALATDPRSNEAVRQVFTSAEAVKAS
jgi:hypothetical protein